MHEVKARPAGTAAARSKTTFRQIPDWLLFGVNDDGKSLVSDKAIRLWAALARHTNDETGRCNPSVDLLAVELCCDRTTIMRLIEKQLEPVGAVEVDRTRRSNSYRLISDAPAGVAVISRTGATSRTDATSRAEATSTSRTDATNTSRTDATLTRDLERDSLNETNDAREIEKIKTLTDAIVNKLPPDSKPSRSQRALIDEGNTHNPKLVELRLRQALTKTKPIAFLTIALKADSGNAWTSPDCPKPPSATKQLASAVTACNLYYGDGGVFEDEIAVWVKRGVDEAELRTGCETERQRSHVTHDDLAARREERAQTEAAGQAAARQRHNEAVDVDRFKPSACPLDEEAADAA